MPMTTKKVEMNKHMNKHMPVLSKQMIADYYPCSALQIQTNDCRKGNCQTPSWPCCGGGDGGGDRGSTYIQHVRNNPEEAPLPNNLHADDGSGSPQMLVSDSHQIIFSPPQAWHLSSFIFSNSRFMHVCLYVPVSPEGSTW